MNFVFYKCDVCSWILGVGKKYNNREFMRVFNVNIYVYGCLGWKGKCGVNIFLILWCLGLCIKKICIYNNENL